MVYIFPNTWRQTLQSRASIAIQFLDHSGSSNMVNSDVSFVYHVEQFVKK